MITLTLKLLGFNVGTGHLALPFDLPVEHYTLKFSVVALDISIGPRTTTPPAHSVPVTKAVAVDHSAPKPEVAASIDPGNFD